MRACASFVSLVVWLGAMFSPVAFEGGMVSAGRVLLLQYDMEDIS